MSKIPQGEWNAIAARYAQGETISQIARGYGCTPPAIHYILKRNGQRAALSGEQPAEALRKTPPPTLVLGTVQAPAVPAAYRSGEPAREEQVRPQWPAGELRPAPARPSDLRANPTPVGRDRESTSAIRPAQGAAQQSGGGPLAAAKTSAVTAGLDNELHDRAEAAIEAFRSSFNAALAEGSPDVREQLRQAASDLMRVAARTTIVLDRLNANTERRPARVQEYARSAHAREHAA